ncbi:hypothetical protein CDD81_3163 [Ophiocordyceps australis]|uniref:Uncharacterized protein n=1 Tax=Ophiocordyceps australis TaxID=1399860 RepID=A0A2C5XVQ6_9HYPO|nr:hypothetical protein CDD81_3163 [Ophiocordyceps australis]
MYCHLISPSGAFAFEALSMPVSPSVSPPRHLQGRRGHDKLHLLLAFALQSGTTRAQLHTIHFIITYGPPSTRPRRRRAAPFFFLRVAFLRSPSRLVLHHPGHPWTALYDTTVPISVLCVSAPPWPREHLIQFASATSPS